MVNNFQYCIAVLINFIDCIDLKNSGEKLLRHDLNEPIEQETSKYDKNAPFRSNSPTMVEINI